MLDKETFEKEIKICQDFSDKGACAWGECEKCGALPLLHKLHTGEVVEDKAAIDKIKDKYGSKK
jgi:hypothetical protein